MIDQKKPNTVFDLISEHALISGHPPFFVFKKSFYFIFLFIIILILIIISSDFREGNTSLLYTGLEPVSRSPCALLKLDFQSLAD